jgi:hypothetical protein
MKIAAENLDKKVKRKEKREDSEEIKEKKDKKEKKEKPAETAEEKVARREKRRKEKEEKVAKKEKKKKNKEKLEIEADVPEKGSLLVEKLYREVPVDTTPLTANSLSSSPSNNPGDKYPDVPPPPYTPQSDPVVLEEESAIPSYHLASKTPGTAEYLALKLTGPGHSCRHFPKMFTLANGVKVPTVLGFFHASSAESMDVSYVDTRKLCKACYEDAVPEGYSVWTTYASAVPVVLPDVLIAGKLGEAVKPRLTVNNDKLQGWLNPGFLPTITSDKMEKMTLFPSFVYVGTEVFRDNLREFLPSEIIEESNGRKSGHRNVAPSIPIPIGSEAPQAWEWIKAERKPFYIDQLHLVCGWNGRRAQSGS